MPLQSTKKSIVYNPSIDSTSAASIMANLISLLTSAGLTSTVSGGVTIFQLQSPDPQKLKAKLIIQLWSDTRFISLQMTSDDGLLLGAVHLIRESAGADFVYQAWADCCQLFISVPGHFQCDIFGEGPWFFACGILFITNTVGGVGPVIVEGISGTITITDCWWSNGQTDGLGIDILTFRATVEPGMFSSCFNGDLMNTDVLTYSSRNQFRLIPALISRPWPHTPGDNEYPDMLYYGSTVPLYFDPLLAWGTGTEADAVAQIRGQLYDSIQGSTYAPVDDLLTLMDSDGNPVKFINYMGSPNTGSGVNPDDPLSKFASLYLMKGVSTSTDFAYMY